MPAKRAKGSVGGVKHFLASWKREGHGFLAMEFKSFYSEIQDTQVDVLQGASVHEPSALSDLLGGSTCMDVDVDMYGCQWSPI
jgi:hypothetical protein